MHGKLPSHTTENVAVLVFGTQNRTSIRENNHDSYFLSIHSSMLENLRVKNENVKTNNNIQILC